MLVGDSITFHKDDSGGREKASKTVCYFSVVPHVDEFSLHPDLVKSGTIAL